ncbi:MAG: NAD(P)H-quinone oxidoreductase, partial [Devosiaceae bacterium]|nr:NAD(P)H-quinone oxidoreductase [Devosiaceae bacterium]
MIKKFPTMHAIITLSAGPPDVMELQEVPMPVAQKGSIVIKTEAAGVNRPDILQRLGVYSPPIGASPLLGLEIAGTVVEIGPTVKNWCIGDPVVALTNGGGYAQFVSVPAGQVLPLPKNYSMVEGAALSETYFTVRQTLIERASLKKGQSVLIHGGASGIGATAIQLTRLAGAVPFATVSSQLKADYAKSMGAEQVINYINHDFVERINHLTNAKGVDVILDIVGGEYLDRHLKCIAIGGTIIQLAMLGGAKAEINLARLLMKQITLFGSTLRAQPDKVKAGLAKKLLKNV